MCNLYRMTKTGNEVAAWFDGGAVLQGGLQGGLKNRLEGANFGAEVYPGYPGLVVRAAEDEGDDESGASYMLRQMTWGFPLVLKGKQGQNLKPKPVNNARTDKLDSFFWRDSFVRRRCLIPVSAWAEAQGAKGAKTRTWLSLPGSELFACAGVWRMSDEWGACYSMVMTGSEGSDAASVHARMPVLLAPDNYNLWLSGDAADAHALCRPWISPLAIDQTSDSWSRGGQMGLL